MLCVHNRYIQPGGEDQVFESEAQLLAENGVRVEKVEEQSAYPDGLVRKIGAAVDCVWSRSWHHCEVQDDPSKSAARCGSHSQFLFGDLSFGLLRLQRGRHTGGADPSQLPARLSGGKFLP